MSTAQIIDDKNNRLIQMIRKAEICWDYIYRTDVLQKEKIGFLARKCEKVIDFGKSSREHYALFRRDQAITVDINQGDDYPDIIDDLCDISSLPPMSADGIVCLAVLEHVYDPFRATDNLHMLLKEGGYCFAYVPFLYRYHAAKDLCYQDYFRYTRDGTALLFKNFSKVTIYPVRGTYSTIANIWQPWKYRVEKIFGQRLNKWIDRIGTAISNSQNNNLQASGFYIWAEK